MTPGEIVTAFAYVVGLAVFLWAARRRKLATTGVGWLVLWGLIGGLIGAKVTQLVAQGWFTVPDPRLGGRALLGGVIGGWAAVEIAKRLMGIRRSTGDLFALGLASGEAVGRIGCFLNGCCYGSICDLPWAVHQHGADRHPAQIYSAIVSTAIFGVLLTQFRRGVVEGRVFRLYLILWAGSRFLLEFVRFRETIFFGLSPIQWLCLEISVSLGVLGLVKRSRMAEQKGG
ncbi:MAG: prolipoprotein diacylglyceryl transferase [Fimbriimonadaceae bacterium]|nr:prolipoprotein diacylglyceryl transferase [Fimbriimonadaceae bacterium]